MKVVISLLNGKWTAFTEDSEDPRDVVAFAVSSSLTALLHAVVKLGARVVMVDETDGTQHELDNLSPVWALTAAGFAEMHSRN